MSVNSFVDALHERAEDVLDRCTRCGGCFEVCPMTAPADLAGRNAAEVVTACCPHAIASVAVTRPSGPFLSLISNTICWASSRFRCEAHP